MMRMSMIRALLLCGTMMAGLGGGGAATAADAAYDVIVRNGMVADGSGAPLLRADVGIKGGYVLAVGDLSAATAGRVIDAKGLYVAPGFINAHDHSLPAALATATNMLQQGVTTEIMNADGAGETDIRRQLDTYAAPGLAVNIGAQIGFNAVWTEIVGRSDTRPSEGQIKTMGDMLVAQMRAGAWGVSSGLDYKPAYFARPAEVTAIVKPVAPWRTYFQNHEKLSPENNFSSVAGMRETVDIATGAGLLPVITHMKLQGHEQGKAPFMLAEFSEARAKGQERGIDVYPYLAGASTLTGLTVPGWAMDGGYPKFVARVKDPAIRAKVAVEIEQAINARFTGPEDMWILDAEIKLSDAMRQRGAGMGETVIQLLEQADMRGIFKFGKEEDLEAILRYPTASIACDCGALPDSGLSANGRFPHPRFYGSFPRVLGHYVRERGVLSWEDAIRKMTGLPASMIGMVDRGYLAPGMAADLAIFNPATIIDKADYANPTAPSVGIDYVLVNGVVAVEGGKPTRAKAGGVLLRAPDMPARIDHPGEREAVGKAALTAVDGTRSGTLSLDYAVAQGADEHAVKGHLRVTGPGGHVVLEARTLGRLQTAPGWAGVTGVVQDHEGRKQAFTMISDESNPTAPKGQRSFSLYLDGKLTYQSAP
ncbi:amidohydrolase family protein [Niveispirillum sp.]|uniref:N-acyl-D-amino-acid deacylase family protein n=1 Tax=Niveispirillum sp. TaxID=1917217 RepID=UPI001B4F3CB7|nr:amidohydrolase family protein [Niveispirillum sp.]MBP7339135.1 amidohydrolase family protein [Niveispirillum sp.]